MTTVQIQKYTKIIKKKTILSDVTLSFEGGKIYGLKGINGSGKTMLLRAICGLIYPTSGSIIINNEVLGKDISFPRSIGALIESPAFLPNFTGLENLKMLASMKNKVSEQEICATIDSVGLDHSDKKAFRKYSLGMKQKLGIAAAIMEHPDIIILDEPFNALDEDSVKIVKELIFNEKRHGALIILACHDSASLYELSDMVYEIKEGVISNEIRKEA